MHADAPECESSTTSEGTGHGHARPDPTFADDFGRPLAPPMSKTLGPGGFHDLRMSPRLEQVCNDGLDELSARF